MPIVTGCATSRRGLRSRFASATKSSTATCAPITDKQERDKVNGLTERKYWYIAPMLRMGQFLMSMGMVRDNTAAFEVILADE